MVYCCQHESKCPNSFQKNGQKPTKTIWHQLYISGINTLVIYSQTSNIRTSKFRTPPSTGQHLCISSKLNVKQVAKSKTTLIWAVNIGLDLAIWIFRYFIYGSFSKFMNSLGEVIRCIDVGGAHQVTR